MLNSVQIRLNWNWPTGTELDISTNILLPVDRLTMTVSKTGLDPIICNLYDISFCHMRMKKLSTFNPITPRVSDRQLLLGGRGGIRDPEAIYI